MPYFEDYDGINTLRFKLAHALRTEYGQSPADFAGLFSNESLSYWLGTGKSSETILLEVAGKPTKGQRAVAR